MSTRIRILPYKQGSKSAKALSQELGGKVLKLEGSTFKPRTSDLIINWGSSGPSPDLQWANIFVPLNVCESVALVANKLTFFHFMKEQGLEITPDFWTDKDSIPDDSFPIVCRSILNGHSGNGIHIADTRDDLIDCPLYVRYVKKKYEYRVHVGKDKEGSYGVFSLQRKARRSDAPQVNWRIRNHDNGFVFVRDGVNPPEDVINSAIQSLQASGLDFGAVDVIWNEHQQRAYVLEVNTAPGLEGQTIKDYANFFREMV